MKANSNGSVTPQMNAQTAAEATSPIAAFFFVLFAHLDHRKSCTGDTKHHTREETGHIHSKTPGYICGGFTCPEVLKISKSDGIKPEYVVQCMM